MVSNVEKQQRRKARRQARKQAERVLLQARVATLLVEEPEPETLGFTHACGFCGKHFMPWDLPQDWEEHMVTCRKLGYGTRISPEALAAFTVGNEEGIAAARAEKRRRKRERKARRKAARQRAAVMRRLEERVHGN